jgi:hypothetical protein
MDIAANKQNLLSTGSIIVLATIGSFVASSAYVLGLSVGLRQPVYEFFQLKDYLEVTPVWLLPTVVYLLALGLVLLILNSLISRIKTPGGRQLTRIFIAFMFPVLLVIFLTLIGVVKNNSGSGQFAMAFWGPNVIHAAWFGFFTAILIVTQMRLLQPEQEGVRIVILVSIIALFVALTRGYSWTPQWIAVSKESTVIVGDNKGVTKDQEIHGKIVLHLERYLLLQDESGDLVAISTSQIKRIDSPPPFPVLSPTPSPTPDPNSIN